jgi:hypothetical protein
MFIYILFSRQPDWFDSEMSNGTIIKTDSGWQAAYNIGTVIHYAPAEYLFRQLEQNEKVKVIYEVSQPEYAAVYSWWGYWIRWQEILLSLIVFIGLYYVAIALNSNLTPEALMEQLEDKPKENKRRYDD